MDGDISRCSSASIAPHQEREPLGKISRKSRPTKTPQVLDAAQSRLSVRDSSVEVMLLALLIDREPFESEVAARTVMGLDGPRQEHGGLHAQVRHAVLHDRQLHRDDARHLDGAAEGDLPIALGEVEVAHAELGARHVDGQEGFTPAAQVLDVAIAAMLGPAGDGPRTFLAHFRFDLLASAAGVDVLGLRGLCHDAVEGVGADEFALAPVPFVEDFLRGGASKDSGVDEAGEPDVWYMPGGAKDAFEVPNGLCAAGNPPLAELHG